MIMRVPGALEPSAVVKWERRRDLLVKIPLMLASFP